MKFQIVREHNGDKTEEIINALVKQDWEVHTFAISAISNTEGQDTVYYRVLMVKE